MTEKGVPRREAAIALFLLLLLAAAALLAPETPGPGPLALLTSVALVHAALLAPALARGGAAWGLLPLPLSAPAICAMSFGHLGAVPLFGSLALLVLACLAGSAGRTVNRSLYLPSMLLVFLAPFALHYLVEEFGGGAGAWRDLSPFVAAHRLADGAWPSAVCILLLLAWPVWALARRGR